MVKQKKTIQLNVRITQEDDEYLENMLRYGFLKSELVRIGLSLVRKKIERDQQPQEI